MVEIKNLTLSYQKNEKILQDISLTIKKGNVYYLQAGVVAENLLLSILSMVCLQDMMELH
ncbi:hypothetical protein HMPREF9466_01432 [Fusobacterium necrophorum subsp. funduliforme 1_1_36S]|nr:hypothetical protein HMPREF9466_01432 [Fusobacterium necrophorum subsp. funduliforme 1_1_36S]